MKNEWKKRSMALLVICTMTTGAWAVEEPLPDDLGWVMAEQAEATADASETKPAETAQETQAPSQPQETAAAAETPTEAASEPTEYPAVEPWKILLVNPWNPLPENFTVELVRLKNGMQVDKRIYADLDEMISACRNAGLNPLICSAYRTKATQTRLYNNKVARLRAAGYGKDAAKTEAARWVALPNTSEHQLGLALDIVSAKYTGLTKKQEQTAEQKWLMEHSWEYGFILRYPTDKSDITGIGYEPWHYRYVGKETAAAMHKSGQCLEEYLSAMTQAQAAQTAQTTETASAAEPSTAAQAAV